MGLINCGIWKQITLEMCFITDFLSLCFIPQFPRLNGLCIRPKNIKWWRGLVKGFYVFFVVFFSAFISDIIRTVYTLQLIFEVWKYATFGFGKFLTILYRAKGLPMKFYFKGYMSDLQQTVVFFFALNTAANRLFTLKK